MTRREIKVVFDTNVIFNSTVHHLLNNETSTFIKENASHTDVVLSWYLPEIVVHERQYQMQRKALDLLPTIQTLEKLLDHILAINEEVLKNKVKENISKQIRENGLKIQKLDTNKVDWNRLINDAAYRSPPFEPGEKEKGFRDSLIAETFLQLVSSSPTQYRECIIVLLTKDQLLSEAVKSRMSGRLNVRILTNIEDLKGLINILITKVSEEFVAKIRAKATTYFFDKSNKKSLYYKEQIQSKIRKKFTKELNELPPGTDKRQNGTWFIAHSGFIKKIDQRFYWATRINVEINAIKSESVESYAIQYPYLSPQYHLLGWQPSIDIPTLQNLIQQELNSQQTTKLPNVSHGSKSIDAISSVSTSSISKPLLGVQKVIKGKSVFEVKWSVFISTTQKFSKAKIESINFIENIWEI